MEPSEEIIDINIEKEPKNSKDEVIFISKSLELAEED